MDFLIFYEHFNREMENVLLIKKELENKGYKVEISHFSKKGYGKNILKSKPKVVITPWLRDNSNVFRFTRFKNKPKLVNLQWEQIYNDNSLELGITSTADLAKNAKHICWGNATKDRLIDEGISADNLKVTGGVQLDFCRKEINEYYFDRNYISKQYGLDVKKKWILFISSFAYATYNEKSLATLSEKWGNIDEFVEISKLSKIEVLEWFAELLNGDPNVELIYRAHPSENIDITLIEMSEKYPGMRIINDYSVKQWIKVSDKITTWYSTSVAEIYAMEKSFCILRPFPIDKKFEVAIMKDASFLTTSEDLMRYSQDENLTNYPIGKDVFNYYYELDEVPAYKKVAEYLIEVLNDPNLDMNFEISKEELKQYKRDFKNDIIVSLLIDFMFKTKIKFSKYIPFKREVFKGMEIYVSNYSEVKEEEIKMNIRKVHHK